MSPYFSLFQTTAPEGWRFKLGDRVRKTHGAFWRGYVVGYYRTGLTLHGVCVESRLEPGSVQIYPEDALERDEA